MAAEAIDFDREVQQLVHQDPLIRADSGIAIWGGEVHAQRISEFLRAWDVTAMPYRLLEYAHRIEFTDGPLPTAAELHLLERARLFGTGGDLSLRRHAHIFHWHFIGLQSMVRPKDVTLRDFWTTSPDIQANPALALRQCHESALLWGDYKAELGRWQDDRVGWASLIYPITTPTAKQPGKRVWLHYTVFTDGGQIAFVWWKELKEHA